MKAPATSIHLAMALICSACASLHSDSKLRDAMAGPWSTADGEILLLIDGPLCIQAEDEEQMLFELSYKSSYALRTELYLDQPAPGGLEMEGESLVWVDPIAGKKHRFKQLGKIPEALILEPFALGSLPSNQVSRDAIGRNLVQRDLVSQDIRDSIQSQLESARLTGRYNDREAQLEFMASPKMISLHDRLIASRASNTEHIGFLLRSSGWITRDVYGEAAQMAAFNMVRFGGNLRIMQSVLPALEAELRANFQARRDSQIDEPSQQGAAPSLGALYTQLYDSVQLSMGKEQLYGTLLFPDINGRLRLSRVADKGSLDQRRKAMGLPPIREFLAFFENRSGPIQVEN